MVPTRPRKMHSLSARSSPTLSGAQEEAVAVEEHGGAMARSNDGKTRTLFAGIAGLGYAADAIAAKCTGNALWGAYLSLVVHRGLCGPCLARYEIFVQAYRGVSRGHRVSVWVVSKNKGH